MLTRLEIDGFKSFADFSVDLRPFMVFVGPNAVGKSNLFDALRLLSRLAEHDLRTAVDAVRGDPADLFRRRCDGAACSRLWLAAEVCLPPRVRDPWGEEYDVSHTRLRYEVEIERRRDDRGLERLFVVKEAATPIVRKDDKWRALASREFQQGFLRYGRRKPLLETALDTERPLFHLHQDGKAGRKRPASAAEATVLSSIVNAEFPLLFALREELRNWRFLQLDPSALRRPSSALAGSVLGEDGTNLASVLGRLRAETRTAARPDGVLAEIAGRLASLIPGVRTVGVEEDPELREFRVKLQMRDEQPFNAPVVSDGTLRVLALLTLLYDPAHGGGICFEEPENGIHPARLQALLQALREMVTDPGAPRPDDRRVFTQILMNSHSPVVLAGLRGALEHVMFVDVVSRVNGDGTGVDRVTRMRCVRPVLPGLGEEHLVSPYEIDQYLSHAAPPSTGQGEPE